VYGILQTLNAYSSDLAAPPDDTGASADGAMLVHKLFVDKISMEITAGRKCNLLPTPPFPPATTLDMLCSVGDELKAKVDIHATEYTAGGSIETMVAELTQFHVKHLTDQWYKLLTTNLSTVTNVVTQAVSRKLWGGLTGGIDQIGASKGWKEEELSEDQIMSKHFRSFSSYALCGTRAAFDNQSVWARLGGLSALGFSIVCRLCVPFSYGRA
jgi:hypothetical protein